MRSLHIRVAAVVAAFSSVFLFAEKKEFWAAKPYTEWTQKDVDKLLKDSPWAKTIPLSQGPELALQGSGRGGRGGEGDSGGAGAGSESYRAQPRLVVTWYSKPVREAVARRLQLNDPSATREQIDQLLNRPASSFYDLLIVGWNPGRNPNAAQALREGTYLQKKNKEKLPLQDVLMPQKRGDPLVLRFAREAGGKPVLTLDDKEVQLVLKMGDNTIRTTFRLSDMVVNERLEL
jgi:hypothetical protein